MFNLKKTKTAQMPYEKYNRENTLGPKGDENAPIGEKKLPHRDGFEQTITEDQIDGEHEYGEKEKTQILEKVLESASGSKYVTHRSDAANLDMPPINVLVEKIRQKRMADDYKVDKESHWSHSFNEKKQQGSLPKWKGNAPQSDAVLLANDPSRFTGSKCNATDFHEDTIKPLVGNITTADIHRVADGIKKGASVDFDTAMLAILRLAHDERRELTSIERRTVVDLKKARTNKLLQK